MKLENKGQESPSFHLFSLVALPTSSSCAASYTSKGRRKGASCPDNGCLSCVELDKNFTLIRSFFQQATHCQGKGKYMTPHHLTATSYPSTKSVLFKWVACLPLLKRVMSYSFPRQQGIASKTIPVIIMSPNIPEQSLVLKKHIYSWHICRAHCFSPLTLAYLPQLSLRDCPEVQNLLQIVVLGATFLLETKSFVKKTTKQQKKKPQKTPTKWHGPMEIL